MLNSDEKSDDGVASVASKNTSPRMKGSKCYWFSFSFLLNWLVAGCSNLSVGGSNVVNIPRYVLQGTKSAVFTLGQPWNSSAEPGLLPTRVNLTWTPENLRVEALLTDQELYSKATADNQNMWELGDVFEVFVKVKGQRNYVEMHTTPNGHLLQLDWPGPKGKATPSADPVPFEDMFVSPVRFHSQVTLTSNGWKVSMLIPARELGLDFLSSGQELSISFCRYDGAPNREPILSSSAKHDTVMDFSRQDEWTTVILK